MSDRVNASIGRMRLHSEVFFVVPFVAFFSFLLLSFLSAPKVHAISSCSSTPTDRGVATTTVNIPVTATYTVWSRIKASSSSNDSYILKIDNQCMTVGNSGLNTNEWTWVNFEDGQTSKKIRLDLSAGNHTVVMAGNEDGVGLDRILFLSDGTCQPTGTGDNCAVNDTTAPDISITDPRDGDIVKGTTNVTVNVSDLSDVAKVELFVDGSIAARSTQSPYSLSWDTTSYSNTTHTIKAKVTDPSNNTNVSQDIQVVINNTATSGVTSRIEAEDYNSGGEGVAYHDITAGNLGNGTCRNDDVDMKNTADIDGVCSIGWFDPGEWMDYTVNIESAGVYDLTLRVANGRSDGTTSGLLGVDLDGNNIAQVSIPNTSSWDTYITVWKGNISLPAGQHTIRLSSIDFFDINWFAFTGDGKVTLASGSGANDTTPPTVPTDLKATSINQQSVSISWSASSDTESGISYYAVYRDDSQIEQATTTSYTDNTVSPESTYTYGVAAVDKAGNFSNKTTITLTTPPVQVDNCLPADVNKDGVVSITDAVAVILKLDSTGSDAGRADVNQDGVVSITDAVAVILKLDQTSGCQ